MSSCDMVTRKDNVGWANCGMTEDQVFSCARVFGGGHKTVWKARSASLIKGQHLKEHSSLTFPFYLGVCDRSPILLI